MATRIENDRRHPQVIPRYSEPPVAPPPQEPKHADPPGDSFEPAKPEKRNWLERRVDDAKDLVGAGQDKVGDVVGAGQERVGDAVDAGREKVGDVVDAGAEKVGDVVDAGEQKLGEARDKAGELVAAGKDAVEAGVDATVGAAKDGYNAVKTAVDYEAQIDKLGKGDKYTFAVGADASVEGIKGYAKGQIEVSVDDKGKYVVTADGELGGGVYAQLGGKAGANASAEGELLGGVGGKVEFKFDNAEQAKRAADTLVRSGSPALAAVKGGPPSPEELKHLTGNISAVEMKGNVAAKIVGELGLGTRGLAEAGLFAEGEIKQENSVRIELEKGKQPSLVVKQETSGQVEGGIQAGLTVTGGTGEGGLAVGASGKVKATVGTEVKFDLPRLDTAKLGKDPAGALREAGLDTLKSGEQKTTVSLQGEGKALGSSKGVEAKLELTQKVEDLLKNGALKKAVEGDFAGAAEAAGDSAKVKAEIRDFNTSGISIKPELRVMGFGGAIQFESLRVDKADRPKWAFEGSGSEAGAALREKLGGTNNPEGLAEDVDRNRRKVEIAA